MRQHFRVALLAGSILAAAAVPARAEDDASKPASGAAAPAPTQNYVTVCCREWVPEQYQCTRTVYRRVCKQENYTAYRWECVPETRTHDCVEYKMVPECKTVVRKVCCRVPCIQECTVMKQCVRYEPYTKIVRRCVDRGHWECRCVPCYNNGRHGRFFRGHKNDCCNPCCDPCNPCCVRMKTVRCWVSCPTWVECPVTCYRKVCECKPCTVKVCSYRTEWREQACQVTCCKCVPVCKKVTCCVMCRKCVPYQACRTVVCCVPHCETVTCCRMVCRTVMKQIPCCDPCCNPCCTPCCNPCGNVCCKTDCCNTSCCQDNCCDNGCRKHRGHRRCGRWSHRSNDCCASSCCN